MTTLCIDFRPHTASVRLILRTATDARSLSRRIRQLIHRFHTKWLPKDTGNVPLDLLFKSKNTLVPLENMIENMFITQTT